MRNVFVLAFALLFVAGCPDVGDAADACRDLLNETVPAVVDEVEARCAKQIDEAAESLIDQFTALIDSILHDAEDEVFTRLGCTRTDAGPGWDCSNSSVCQ